MINQKHPIYELIKLSQIFSEATFEFSKYVYLGYGKTKSRDVFSAKASVINKDWLTAQLNLLEKNEELALHSKVLMNEEIYHLPMIDFINVNSIDEIASEIKDINEMVRSPLSLFYSGHSLHGYYFTLLRENEWLNYIALLLLCNPPSLTGDQIVDTRWVGHSLLHRFSALRWSHNSELYKSMPEQVENKTVLYL